MNTVVVAATTVTTLTTEIVQLIPDSNTGIALHSQWRCSTCGALLQLPETSVHVEHLHTGEKLTLLSAIVHHAGIHPSDPTSKVDCQQQHVL